MSGPTFEVPFTTSPNAGSLPNALELHKKETFLDLNCHAIGTIQTFDSANQTAQVSINYKKAIFMPDSTGQLQPQLVDYPVLADCPVIFLGGGTGSLTFPVEEGDECLVFFNDRDIDNWFTSSNTNGAVASTRLHSMADAIALVGIRSLANVLDDFDTTRVALRNENAVVALGQTLIKIENNTQNLNSLLQELINDVKSLVSATAAITVTGVTSGGSFSGPPVNAATISAVSSQLTTTASKIAELLE